MDPPPAGFTPATRIGAPALPPVRVLAYTPEHVALETETREPAVLVLSDTFDARWRAWDNGQPVPIMRGDHAFRAVFLSAGHHRVEFRYRRPIVYAGLAITLATLGALGVAWIVTRRRRAGAETPEAGGPLHSSAVISAMLHVGVGAGADGRIRT